MVRRGEGRGGYFLSLWVTAEAAGQGDSGPAVMYCGRGQHGARRATKNQSQGDATELQTLNIHAEGSKTRCVWQREPSGAIKAKQKGPFPGLCVSGPTL